MSDGYFHELIGKGFELLPVGDGGSQGWCVFGLNPLTDIGLLSPHLMFEVGAQLGPGSQFTILGFETALFHGLEFSHLLENLGSLDVEFSVHFGNDV